MLARAMYSCLTCLMPQDLAYHPLSEACSATPGLITKEDVLAACRRGVPRTPRMHACGPSAKCLQDHGSTAAASCCGFCGAGSFAHVHCSCAAPEHLLAALQLLHEPSRVGALEQMHCSCVMPIGTLHTRLLHFHFCNTGTVLPGALGRPGLLCQLACPSLSCSWMA